MVPVGTVLAKQYHLDTTGTPTSDYPTYSEDLFVPPPTPEPAVTGVSGELWIDVDLSNEYLTVYDGTIDIAETYVSTGRQGFETPTGTFYINSKLNRRPWKASSAASTTTCPMCPG